MNQKNKQIEEMAHSICCWWNGKGCTFGVVGNKAVPCRFDCNSYEVAEKLYETGYRKLIPEHEKVIQMLDTEYERAKNMEFVKKPLAWALYQVWKKIDARKAVRGNESRNR